MPRYPDKRGSVVPNAHRCIDLVVGHRTVLVVGLGPAIDIDIGRTNFFDLGIQRRCHRCGDTHDPCRV